MKHCNQCGSELVDSVTVPPSNVFYKGTINVALLSAGKRLSKIYMCSVCGAIQVTVEDADAYRYRENAMKNLSDDHFVFISHQMGEALK